MVNNPFLWKTFDWDPLEYDEMDTIEEDGKRFYKTPIGNLPSMTTMLQILDDGGIAAWEKRVGQEEADKIRDEAADRGNSLHDISELYLNNKLKRGKIDGKGSILFSRVKKYLDEIEVVRATEIPLYSKKFGYAGRVDAVVVHRGTLTVLDHKNARWAFDLSKQYSRRKLFKYMLQCVGYAICIYEMYGLVCKKGCVVVGIHEESRSEIKTFDIAPLLPEFKKLIQIRDGELDPKESMFWKI